MSDDRNPTGLITVHRIRGGRSSLVGSDVPHPNRIQIKVSKAEYDRDLNNDTFYPLP